MPNFRHWTWTARQSYEVAKGTQLAMARNTAENNRPAGLELLYIGTNKEIYDARQVYPTDPDSWEDQPQIPSDKPNQPAKAKQIVLGANFDGRLILVYIGTNNEIYYIDQPQKGQFAWALSSSVLAGQKATNIAIALDSTNRITLVHVGTDKIIYIQRQDAPGIWSAPKPLATDSKGNFLKGKQVAVSPNPNNSNLLEVFYVGETDNLYHAIQQSTDIFDWNHGDEQLGSLTVSTVTVATNQDGRLEIFYIDTKHRLLHDWYATTAPNSGWGGPARFFGASAKQVNVAVNQDGRLEMFYVGTDNNLYHNWQVAPNAAWVGETQFPGDTAKDVIAMLNLGGALEMWSIGTDSYLYLRYQTVPNSGWTNANGQGAVVAPPNVAGLEAPASWANYAAQNCAILTDVAISITLTEDLIAEIEGFFPDNGVNPPNLFAGTNFSWQVNCYSVTGAADTWQQYGIGLGDTKMYGWVDNWFDFEHEVWNNGVSGDINHLGPAKGKIPAGYQLFVRLGNDIEGNITEVFFLVANADGDAVGQKRINLLDHIKPKNLSPIVAVEVVLVGEYDGLFVGFKSAGGTIQYVSSALMQIAATKPNCAAVPGGETQESSNAVYGPMTDAQTNLAIQTFSCSRLVERFKPPRPEKGFKHRIPGRSARDKAS